MIITGIKKNKKNFDIYLDNEFAFTITDEGLYKLKIKIGDFFEFNERVKEILFEDEVLRCKNRAFYILTFSHKSEKFLRKKLVDENFSENAVERTLKILKDYSIIDDDQLAQNIVKNSLRKKYSKVQIKNKLFNKGISKENTTQILEELEIDENNNAYEAALKKYNSMKSKPYDEIIKKIRYTLSYRGFSYNSCKYAIKEIDKIIRKEMENE